MNMKFVFHVMQCSAHTNTKSINDNCICTHTSYKQAIDDLIEINKGMVRGLAYIKFEKVMAR